MKRHIQLNQGRMNYFRNNISDGRQTYCLSLPDLVISSKKIKELGAKDDYYSHVAENVFSDNYEQPFGEVLNKINKGFKLKTTSFPLLESDKIVIQRFCAINISRAPITNILADLKCSSSFAFSCNHDLLPSLAHSIQSKTFEEYGVRFIYNSSNTGLILPSFGYYKTYDKVDKKNIVVVIPVCDKIAIVLDKDDCVEYSVTNITDDREIIDKYNLYAFMVELNTNCQFLISKTEKPLLDIKNIMQSETNQSNN